MIQGLPAFDKASLEEMQNQAFRDAAAEYGLTWREAESIVVHYRLEMAKLTKKFRVGQQQLSMQFAQRLQGVADRKKKAGGMTDV